ncbi:protein FAM117B [Salmo salar]|uniref:Protein FAM117B n=1 Tax=Salmo salar TaxID=8030 RepID=A0ABM3D1L2_SALSA|nr:protein FAM117B-like [Salmo salar]
MRNRLPKSICTTRPSNCSISTSRAQPLYAHPRAICSLLLVCVCRLRQRHLCSAVALSRSLSRSLSPDPPQSPLQISGRSHLSPRCWARTLHHKASSQRAADSAPPISSGSSQLWPLLGTLPGSYQIGPRPQDGSHAHHTPCMRDKATQTPRAWADERRRGSHKRSASCGSTDQLKEIAKLRQQLQRSKRSSRHRRDKDRKSPFNGSHAAITQSQAQMPNKTILIPVPKSTAPRFRNSVEGLNQEIERIIIRDTPQLRDEVIIPQDVPDGHRAPLPLPLQRSSSTRSIDTQTPSGGLGGGKHSNSSSRPDSISPSYLTILNDMGGGSPYPVEEKDPGPCSPLQYAASPKPNNSYMFKREPPEGCEKVKVFEESIPRPLQEIPPFLCPDRNKVNFIPKSGSAFCLVSILKPLLPAPELSFRSGVGLRSLSPSLVPLGGVGLRSLSPSMMPLGGVGLRSLSPSLGVSWGTSTVHQQPCLPRHLEEPES